MSKQDTRIEWLKARVNCAALLERLPPVWRLDRVESTRRSLKYRRGEGEIVIVNHDGCGWWDPLSDRKGDIFTLVRHLEPGLTFPNARRVLRDFVGIAPAFPEMRSATRRTAIERSDRRTLGAATASVAWITGVALSHRTAAACRTSILLAARAVDVVREGPHGSAWFAHRNAAGYLTGIEMRGPDYHNFSAGGGKTLFRLPGGTGPLSRVAVCEGAIDALSLAAIERCRADTLYAATSGGMGPETLIALQQLLRVFVDDPACLLIAATDADIAGRRHAVRLETLAAEAGVRFEMILPPDGLNDWNDVLREMAPAL